MHETAAEATQMVSTREMAWRSDVSNYEICVHALRCAMFLCIVLLRLSITCNIDSQQAVSANTLAGSMICKLLYAKPLFCH